jgi:hypothetical protein
MGHARRTPIEEHVTAKIAPSTQAIRTAEARPARVDRDGITNREADNLATDLGNLSRNLVADDQGLLELKVTDSSLEVIGKIRAADSAGPYRNPDVVLGQGLRFDLSQAEVLDAVNLKCVHAASPMTCRFGRGKT